MHIVDVTMFFARESGGVRRYLTAKHHWLQQRTRIRHSLLVPGATEGPAANPAIHHFSCPRIPFTNGYRAPLYTMRAEQAMRRLAPDLLEAGDPYQLAWSTLRVGRELNIPVVGFYHSDLPRLLEMRLGKVGYKVGLAYVKYLYAHFDLVLAPSHAMLERLQEAGITTARHQALGVDTDLFTPPADPVDIRAKLGLSPQTRLLVYVGRFTREKNLPLLFSAVQRLGSPYHLLVIGSGGRVPPIGNISQHPFVANPKQLVRLMAGCDALVHSGDQETFGLAVLEAMACGLPVVGMARGGVAELVQPDTGVLVEPGSVDRFAEGIRSLFENDPQRLGQQARKHVLQQYGWDHVMPQLLHHYASLRPESSHAVSLQPVLVSE